MMMNLGNDHVKLAQDLLKLTTIFERLQRRRRIKIVWLSQPPSIDSIFMKREFYVRSFNIHSDKIERYNQVIRETIKSVIRLVIYIFKLAVLKI